MKTYFLRPLVAALAFAGILATVPAQPAKADTTSTILITAASVAALATAYNVEHKHQLANTVVGYLSDGSTVYQDGHVRSTNGSTWYPSNSGQTISCTNNSCYTYNGNNSNQYGSNQYGYNGNNGYNGTSGNTPYAGNPSNPYYNVYSNGTPNNTYNNGYNNNGYNNRYNNGYNSTNNGNYAPATRHPNRERRERDDNGH